MTSEEINHKYVIHHELTIPTASYANEKFSYVVKGDDMKEVIKDIKQIKKLYPPVTQPQKETEASKPVRCPNCLREGTLYKIQSGGMGIIKCTGGKPAGSPSPCKYEKKYKLSNQPTKT